MTATTQYRSKAAAIAVRTEACRLAAQVIASRPEDKPAPLLWSLTVFFEAYILGGAEATVKNFAPKKPVRLKVVRRVGG